MNIIDYLLLAAISVAALYTFYRLFFGYLRSRCEEMTIEEGEKIRRSSERPPTHNGFTTGAPWLGRN